MWAVMESRWTRDSLSQRIDVLFVKKGTALVPMAIYIAAAPSALSWCSREYTVIFS